MGCAPLPVLKLPSDVAVLSGPERPEPTIGRTPPPDYLGGTTKTFALVCLNDPMTAPIVMCGLGKAARDDKPDAAAEGTQKKVAQFHRVQCLGGHVEIVQAWSKGEARALVKKRGYELARVGRETGQGKRAA